MLLYLDRGEGSRRREEELSHLTAPAGFLGQRVVVTGKVRDFPEEAPGKEVPLLQRSLLLLLVKNVR
jgi:hypothetical protein